MRTKTVRADQVTTAHALLVAGRLLPVCERSETSRTVELVARDGAKFHRETHDRRDRVKVTDKPEGGQRS